MLKIGFTGVPGTGKSTLARSVASKCSIINLKNVELISEYARRYISKYGNVESIFEQFRILEKQVDWEQSVQNEKLDIMLTDSPIFLGFVYCCSLPKENSKEIMFFNDIFKKMLKLNYPTPRYDIIFHLNPTFKTVNDGVRPIEHFDESWREKANLMILATMEIFKPKVLKIVDYSKLEDRTDYCLKVLKDFLNKP